MYQESPMWLVYIDGGGTYRYQSWDEVDTGNAIDPVTGEDMPVVGWTTERPLKIDWSTDPRLNEQ